MAEKATILIPDISGCTDFTSKTALGHSSHIINELLDLIVRSNELGVYPRRNRVLLQKLKAAKESFKRYCASKSPEA